MLMVNNYKELFQESVHQYLDLGTLQQVVGVVTFSTEMNRERERENDREGEGRKEGVEGNEKIHEYCTTSFSCIVIVPLTTGFD